MTMRTMIFKQGAILTIWEKMCMHQLMINWCRAETRSLHMRPILIWSKVSILKHVNIKQIVIHVKYSSIQGFAHLQTYLIFKFVYGKTRADPIKMGVSSTANAVRKTVISYFPRARTLA